MPYRQQYSSRDLISAKYTRSKWNGETPLRLRTRKMCKLFDALVTISLMCTSHFRLFWIVKPNTLWDSILSRLIFSTTKVGAWRLLSVSSKGDDLSLHFLAFNFILLVLVQSPIAFNSFCRIDTSLDGTISYIVTSSTYFQLLERRDTIFKSSIIMRKRIGPNSIPCGTPALVGSHRDTHCPNLTHWRRFERKLSQINQFCYN